MRLLTRGTSIALLAVTLAACAPPAPESAPPPAAVAAIVSVNNGLYPDVNVFLLRDGTTVRRVGFVAGHSQSAFALTHADVVSGSNLAFRARAVGGVLELRSPNVPALAGQLYEWRLGVSGPSSEFLSYRQASMHRANEPPNRWRLARRDSALADSIVADSLRWRARTLYAATLTDPLGLGVGALQLAAAR